MELISANKESGTKTGLINLFNSVESFEVAVVEDNKLINLILSNELDELIVIYNEYDNMIIIISLINPPVIPVVFIGPKRKKNINTIEMIFK